MREAELRRLAAFRVALRQFEFFSEQVSGELGLTSQQYQALLVTLGDEGAVPFTLKVLAQKLNIKHNSAVGLVDRIEQLGLVVRRSCEDDRRSVRVELTERGKMVLNQLAIQHRRELHRVAPEFGRYFRHFARTVDETEWREPPRRGRKPAA
ncbi:Organic hydroperoxide resistance transcriptional regulator [Variovorax sp. SRS16]|nr:Organic hydroperoxide resistance transcriptional regulator [Variovorax sp. SRS16]